jgi:hypothetical protein
MQASGCDQPPNKRIQPTPLRVDKIGGILEL